MSYRVTRPARKWTDADKGRLVELWNAGATETAIQATLNRSLTAIQMMRRDLGLPSRNPWVQRRGLARRGAA